MSRKLVNTKKISYEDWVEIRKRSIGGSDASTVMNENKYSSLYALYTDKLGLVKPKQTNIAMARGTHDEEFVAQLFCQETGLKVRNDFIMYQHDDYDFITANIDRKVVGENAGLECKTTMAYGPKDFENGNCPANYYWQCQQYMAVMGFDRMYLAVLTNYNQFIYTIILRDDEAIERLIKAECDFWNDHILTEIPPEVDGSDATTDALKELYPESNGETIEADVDMDIELYLQADAEIKKWEERKKMAQQRVIEKLGSAECGVGRFYQATYKSQVTNRFDSTRFKKEHPDMAAQYNKVSESRRFTIKEMKINE